MKIFHRVHGAHQELLPVLVGEPTLSRVPQGNRHRTGRMDDVPL